MIPFNFHHLYYFYIVAKEGSFTKAANILRVSQPALSAQLKQFQNYWDFQLFNRNGNQLRLTDHGDLIFGYAKAIFDLGQELNDRLVNPNKDSDLRIQLGVAVAVPKAVITSLFRYLYSAYPDINLVLKQDRVENMIEDLMRHHLDIVVNDGPYPSQMQDGVQNHLVGTIPMVFCVNKSLAHKFRNIPKDLNDARLIVPTAPDQTYQAIQNYIHMNKIKPKIIAEVENLELVRSLVVMGKGVGLLNLYNVMNSSDWKKLAVLKDKSKYKINDTIYLIKRQRKIPHPVVDQVVENFRLPFF